MKGFVVINFLEIVSRLNVDPLVSFIINIVQNYAARTMIRGNEGLKKPINEHVASCSADELNNDGHSVICVVSSRTGGEGLLPRNGVLVVAPEHTWICFVKHNPTHVGPFVLEMSGWDFDWPFCQ